MRYLRYMLVFVPLALVAEFFLHIDILIFLASALALIPLPGVLGKATEELAIHKSWWKSRRDGWMSSTRWSRIRRSTLSRWVSRQF